MRRRLRHPLERFVRRRIVANVDSIGLAVRMLCQRAAGKPHNASSSSRSSGSFSAAFGFFSPQVSTKLLNAASASSRVLSHPDLLQRLIRSGLDAFGQDVQDAARLAQPAAPVAGVRIRLVQRRPESQGPVADRRQGAQLRVLGPKPAADPVRPDAGPAAVGQVLSAPLLHFPVPLLRRARHARGREPLRLGPQQNLQGLGHLAAGSPFRYSHGTNASTLAASSASIHRAPSRAISASESRKLSCASSETGLFLLMSGMPLCFDK